MIKHFIAILSYLADENERLTDELEEERGSGLDLAGRLGVRGAQVNNLQSQLAECQEQLAEKDATIHEREAEAESYRELYNDVRRKLFKRIMVSHKDVMDKLDEKDEEIADLKATQPLFSMRELKRKIDEFGYDGVDDPFRKLDVIKQDIKNWEIRSNHFEAKASDERRKKEKLLNLIRVYSDDETDYTIKSEYKNWLKKRKTVK